MTYSRGKSPSLIEKFVKMYVNDVTVEMGQAGESAIRRMFEMATKKNLVAPFELKISMR
jgi:1,4-dihydroxy-6-naphthoate synthase